MYTLMVLMLFSMGVTSLLWVFLIPKLLPPSLERVEVFSPLGLLRTNISKGRFQLAPDNGISGKGLTHLWNEGSYLNQWFLKLAANQNHWGDVFFQLHLPGFILHLMSQALSREGMLCKTQPQVVLMQNQIGWGDPSDFCKTFSFWL